MAESEEALQLKRRARRRLVGAIALVTFVVTILPLLLDKEPGPAGPPLEVQIPKPESGGFAARIGPPAAKAPSVAGKNAEAAPPKTESPSGADAATPGKAELPVVRPAALAPKAEPSAVEAAAAKAASPAADKAAVIPTPTADKGEQERAQAALNGEAWVVALDAFSDSKNVKQLRTRLSAAGVKSYTEPVRTSRGELTRVRAGPFFSKEAAEQARARLESMGLKPGAVASR